MPPAETEQTDTPVAASTTETPYDIAARLFPAETPAPAAAPAVDDDTASDDPATPADAKPDSAGTAKAVPATEDEDVKAFEKAAAKHELPLTLDDLPADARPMVEQKLKHMQAGFTRVMQKAAEFRTEKATFDAEQAYQRDHPDQYLADRLLADPSLADKVNAELKRREDPTYAAAVAKDREITQREAALTAKEALETQQQRDHRAEAVITYTERAAKAAEIPFELVEDAIAHAVTISDTKDITNAEIDAIIAAKAETYHRHVSAHKGAAKRSYAKEKASDAKASDAPLRPSAAIGTRPNTVKLPTDSKKLSPTEFANRWLDANGY